MFDEFNKTVIVVFKAFKSLKSTKFGTRVRIDEIQSRIVRGIDANVEYATRMLGPLLWESRERLTNCDTEYFIKYNHDIDVKRLCNQHDVDYGDAMNTVNYMKDVFANATDQERKDVYTHIHKLIGLYAVYMLSLKK